MGWKMKICAINSLTFILFMLYFFQINRRTKNSELRCLTLNNVIAARRETRDARRETRDARRETPLLCLKTYFTCSLFFHCKTFYYNFNEIIFYLACNLAGFLFGKSSSSKACSFKIKL